MEKFLVILHWYFRIFQLDLKNIFRDTSLSFLLLIPLSFIVLINLGLPRLIAYFPIFQDYSQLIVLVFSLFAALFPAFIFSFILLDEKDQHLLQVINVSPISLSRFLATRLSVLGCYSFFSAAIILFLVKSEYSVNEKLLIAFWLSWLSLIAFLIITALARNKIEGVAVFKVVNFLLILPVMSFFLDGSWAFLFWLIPDYWTFNLILGENVSWLQVAGAFFTHSGWIIFGFFLFNSRNRN